MSSLFINVLGKMFGFLFYISRFFLFWGLWVELSTYFAVVIIILYFALLGIDANIRDCQGRTALENLQEHPSQTSLQIASLIQGNVVQTPD